MCLHTDIDEWLADLEGQSGGEAYLWPNTAVGNPQAEIWRRVGVSDWNLEDNGSRPRQIADTLQEMHRNGLLAHPFSVLDLCCGDGVVLLQIARIFYEAQCYGVDLLYYPTHDLARVKAGCRLYRASLQRVVASQTPHKLDVGLMLNTFRGWNRAALPSNEADLPQMTLDWMKRSCKYVFLTVTLEQEGWLRQDGWFTFRVGRGEDGSQMICAFPCDNGNGLWGKHDTRL